MNMGITSSITSKETQAHEQELKNSDLFIRSY